MAKDFPVYDPEKDPDLKAAEKTRQQLKEERDREALPAEEQVKLKGTPLVVYAEPEPAPTFDEVQSGADIPDENIEALIAGTLGGSGDNHASAKRIVERMHEAKWTVTKALDEGIGDTRAKKGKHA